MKKAKNKKMPVVILCGGMGSRLSEQTEIRPKPLIEIGGKPILWHIMKHYSHYGFNEFILALGYKGEQIKRYFLDFYILNQDFSISLKTGIKQTITNNNHELWKIDLIDTGTGTATGGRLKGLEDHIKTDTFLMTYGDGVSNLNIDELISFHKSHKGLVTLSAVRPPARFGALEFDGSQIRFFKEKSILHEGWINGGFFVVEKRALQFINGDVMWEHAPMEDLAQKGELFAYKHEGFWQCLDTMRDLKYLESLWNEGTPLWKTW